MTSSCPMSRASTSANEDAVDDPTIHMLHARMLRAEPGGGKWVGASCEPKGWAWRQIPK